MKRPALDRWLQFVLIGDGCWIWTGATDTAGYGRFYFDGFVRPAHRIGYDLLVAPIPDALVACHRCDTPSCVCPGHIFPGSQKENVEDMMAKGRGNFGKRLTLQIAQEIRRAARDERPSQGTLARAFGVSKSTVSEILLGQTWPDGSGPIHIDGTGSRHPRSKLTPADVAAIRRARADGMLLRDIAARYGISKPSARAAALGLSYRGEIA